MVLQESVSITAGDTVNVLSGKRISTIPIGKIALVSLYATASAAGLLMSMFVGERNPVESSQPSTANRMPIVPDDLVASGIGALANEQITLQVNNPVSVPLTFFYRVEVQTKSA